MSLRLGNCFKCLNAPLKNAYPICLSDELWWVCLFVFCFFFIHRAFSATECVESQWAIADNSLTELSVQELISCSRPKGCSGGNTYEALVWLQNMVCWNLTGFVHLWETLWLKDTLWQNRNYSILLNYPYSGGNREPTVPSSSNLPTHFLLAPFFLPFLYCVISLHFSASLCLGDPTSPPLFSLLPMYFLPPPLMVSSSHLTTLPLY